MIEALAPQNIQEVRQAEARESFPVQVAALWKTNGRINFQTRKPTASPTPNPLHEDPSIKIIVSRSGTPRAYRREEYLQAVPTPQPVEGSDMGKYLIGILENPGRIVDDLRKNLDEKFGVLVALSVLGAGFYFNGPGGKPDGRYFFE